MLVAVAAGTLDGLPLAALAATRSVPVIAMGALIFGVVLMLGNTLWETTLQRHVPPESLSRVSSYDWFGSLALDPVGLAIWGPIAAVIGIDAALWTAWVLLVAAASALLAVPEIRHLPPAPVEGCGWLRWARERSACLAGGPQTTTEEGPSMTRTITIRREKSAPAEMTGASLTGAMAVGARLFGPSAMGPLAIAVSAIGAIAIGRLAIAEAVIRRLRAEELEIGSLKVRELEVAGQRWPASGGPSASAG